MKKNIYIINLIYQISILILVLLSIITVSVWINLIDKDAYGLSESFTIAFTIICILFYIVYCFINVLYLINVKNQSKFSVKFKVLFLIILLNPFVFLNDKNDKNFLTTNNSLTKQITQLALTFALYIIFSFIFYTYQLPLSIEIPIGYAIVVYFALNNRFRYSFSLTLICCLFQAFLPGVVFLNIYQYMLDYGLIILSISFVSFLRFNNKDFKTIFLNTSIIVFLLSIIFYISRILSGVLFWLSSIDSKLNALSYSAIFNSLNVLIDFISLTIIVTFLSWRIPNRLWN